MSRHDWYRRTSWTDSDRQAFFDRLRRTRRPDARSQYLRIQAVTLFETHDRGLIEAAMELLGALFRDHPHALDLASAYELAGQCCEAMGRVEEAISHYRSALRRQDQHPEVLSNAGYRLGKLAVEQNRMDLYDECDQALEALAHQVLPWNVYLRNGIRAAIAASRGELDAARSLTVAALRAAAIRDSGLGGGRRSLGIVDEVMDPFRRQLELLAGS